MDSRSCVHVWMSASLCCRLCSMCTRNNAQAPCLGTGWAPIHTPPLLGFRRRYMGSDGCWGGHGGHNGRMWCIVLVHGAVGWGLPGCECHGLTHATRLMTDGAHGYIDPNHETTCYQRHDKVRNEPRKDGKNNTNIKQGFCNLNFCTEVFGSSWSEPWDQFSTFQLSLSVTNNWMGRHQWGCKFEWVRKWNVSQPIRHHSVRLTANQVKALQLPKRRLNSKQIFLKRSWTFHSRRCLLLFVPLH